MKLELIRHSQHNAIYIRRSGTPNGWMLEPAGSFIMEFQDDYRALTTAREYAASKGWELDETIPARHYGG